MQLTGSHRAATFVQREAQRQHSYQMVTFEAVSPLVGAPEASLVDDGMAVVFLPFNMSTKEPLSTDDRTVDTHKT